MGWTYLSYPLNDQTPSYGNFETFRIRRVSAISEGKTSNGSEITTNVHVGTHVDMPFHFHDDGQKIDAFPPDFWHFQNPLFIEVEPRKYVIHEELVEVLSDVKEKASFDALFVKTGICYKRGTEEYWDKNYGFAPEVSDYLREQFPKVRLIGFDSISVSSFQDRPTGRIAHRAFLNPEKPILLLEDMDLRETKNFSEVIVAPMIIENCDGLPVTVMAR